MGYIGDGGGAGRADIEDEQIALDERRAREAPLRALAVEVLLVVFVPDFFARGGIEFLKPVYRKMPRTMLRYAIEKFGKLQRDAYLKGRV